MAVDHSKQKTTEPMTVALLSSKTFGGRAGGPPSEAIFRRSDLWSYPPNGPSSLLTRVSFCDCLMALQLTPETGAQSFWCADVFDIEEASMSPQVAFTVGETTSLSIPSRRPRRPGLKENLLRVHVLFLFAAARPRPGRRRDRMQYTSAESLGQRFSPTGARSRLDAELRRQLNRVVVVDQAKPRGREGPSSASLLVYE